MKMTRVSVALYAALVGLLSMSGLAVWQIELFNDRIQEIQATILPRLQAIQSAQSLLAATQIGIMQFSEKITTDEERSISAAILDRDTKLANIISQYLPANTQDKQLLGKL